ncbi:MAG: HAMP domain-containing histidine kinase [Thermoleophilaceae bacterium]|nr:HAMP domain-containing histidine kinase [Thermoleophilaceae bacterium]
MRSLRGRLVAILLLVSLGGMIVLAAVTFAEQRSYLYDRLDRQVQSGLITAVPVLAFAQQSGSGSCQGAAPGSGPFGRDEDDDRQNERGPGGRGGFSLPPGTYAALVDSSGAVIASCSFGFERSEGSTVPDLSSVGLSGEPQTVGSTGSDDTEFRVATRSAPTGERIVVAVPLNDTRQTINRLVLVETVVILFALLVLGIAAWLLVGIGLRPLDRMGTTADAIAGGDISHRVEPADERSEIGRLGLALNGMLERLEGAFKEREASENRLRQFLADASHELRTPLVSIRGYSELYRLGATREEAEVDRSMERIEQEAARMGVLVEDMLTLARLDETHENAFAPVDVSELAADALRDAEVAAPDRTITLTADGPQRVSGDAHQLQQVFANLLRNAIVHTPEGTPIEVAVARDDEAVRIDVRDHGPGLPDGAGEQIFERFWRSETGRERGKAGSGLGLSIVAGIVDAHGGRVEARNAEDPGGAVFSIWLPLPA